MIGYLKAFGIFLVWAAIALASHYLFTHELFEKRSKNKNTVRSATVEEKNTPLYILNDSKDTLLTIESGITIYKGSAKLTGKNKVVESLYKFLEADYSKKAIITAKYADDEADNSPSSIGQRRATDIFNTLKYRNISESQLAVDYILENNLFANDSLNNNGVDISISSLKSEEIQNIEETIITRRFYLAFENEIREPTEELIDYVPLLRNYLKRNPDEKIYITGHTANTGYYQENLRVGQARADQLKAFFVKKQISESRIVAQSRGEAEPIAKKGTIEGRRLNKRIEIAIR